VIKRTTSNDPDFKFLIRLLDQELERRYPSTYQDTHEYDVIKTETNAVVAYYGKDPVGSGCIRGTDTPGTVEMKRVYVVEGMRRRGVAEAMMGELERWAIELGWKRAILETGVKQPEAIALYTKIGYARIPNFGPYAGADESVCMVKDLQKHKNKACKSAPAP
jgi:GNAT superfamily N-acetyltransferase